MSDLEDTIEEPNEDIYNANNNNNTTVTEECYWIFPIYKEIPRTITPFMDKILTNNFKWWVLVYNNQLTDLFNIFISHISHHANDKQIHITINIKNMFNKTIYNCSSKKIHQDCIDDLLLQEMNQNFT